MIYPPIIDNSKPYKIGINSDLKINYYLPYPNGINTSIILVKILDENNRSIHIAPWDGISDQYAIVDGPEYEKYYPSCLSEDSNYYQVVVPLSPNTGRGSWPKTFYIQLMAVTTTPGDLVDGWLANPENKDKQSIPSDMVVWNRFEYTPFLSVTMEGQRRPLEEGRLNYMKNASSYSVEGIISNVDENDAILYGQVDFFYKNKRMFKPVEFLSAQKEINNNWKFQFNRDEPIGFATIGALLELRVTYRTKKGYQETKTYALKYGGSTPTAGLDYAILDAMQLDYGDKGE